MSNKFRFETLTFKQRTHRRANRRGVTLMFVVTIIVLLMLMATSFVVISNNYYQSARRRGQAHIYSNTTGATDLIERAFYDLVRGPSLEDSLSPLRGQSILGDMYGYGFVVTAQTAGIDKSEHFIKLTLNDDATKVIDGTDYTPIPVPGMFGGLVVTITSGRASGISGRVIDHQVTGDSVNGYTHSVIIMPAQKDVRFNAATAADIRNSRLVFNGRPFAGTGAGHYDTSKPQDEAALDEDLATHPNRIGNTARDLFGKNGQPGYFSRELSGGRIVPNSMAPNESYDAFDCQNVFLGGIQDDGKPIAVSFYRYRDEDTQAGGLIIGGSTKHKRGDFRAFTGSSIKNNDKLAQDKNVQVDNNHDGEEDGIWMDIGLPMICQKDGSCVKPLVSYLVVDLDGRINVNAHGSYFRDIAPNMRQSINFLDTGSVGLPTGMGYGPAEISMHKSLTSAKEIMDTRYGPPSDYLPGEPNVRDAWASYKLFGYPEESFVSSIPGTVSGHFGTAMDIHGRFSIGYPQLYDASTGDERFPVGLPVTNVGISDLDNEIIDSPYEMSLVEPYSFGPDSKWDNPFSADELEHVLRPSDVDSPFLNKRLLQFLPTKQERNVVTTHSFEVPTLYSNLPSRLYRLLDDGMPNNGSSDREERIREHVRLLLPPEIFRGLPMDVNRPFGEGKDNNGNLIVDDIAEQSEIEHPTGKDVLFDLDNDAFLGGEGDDAEAFARAKFATHLYIVALLTTERVDRNGDSRIDLGDFYDFNDDGTVDNDDLIDFRKVVGQWAINVVDFRDVDSVNTAFEFDIEPWNGWNVDGDIRTSEPTERFVVWGAERPELLLTETLATHDRRTQNLETETVPEGEDAVLTTDGDEDFDSHLVPRVSAFFEIYNPWVMNDANQLRAPELYNAGSLDGVDLQKTSNDGSTPVWRLVVTDTDEQDFDPDEPSRNEGGRAVTHVRRIYFTRPGVHVDEGLEVFFPDEDLTVDPVYPGTYTVVGTAGKQVGSRFDTYFGRRRTPDALDANVLQNQTRRISLDPTNRSLEIVYFDTTTQEMALHTRNVNVLPIQFHGSKWERELGVSDPQEGYFGIPGVGISQVDLEEIEDGLKFTEDETKGTPVDYAFDTPVDKLLDEDHYEEFLRNDGLRPGYRTVHLQRLANPLNPFDEVTNPYLTIDSSSIDLFVFNGAETFEDPNNEPGVMRFGSYERRGDKGEGPHSQINSDSHRVLFRQDRIGYQNADQDLNLHLKRGSDNDDSHILSYNLFEGDDKEKYESLGVLNQAYRDANQGNNAFAWLTWNNRPYVSHLELANVPYTSSSNLTRQFSVADASLDVFEPPTEYHPDTGAPSYASPFAHLLNFHADKVDSGDYAASFHRLLDYLEVPSRFTGTESYVNPETFVDEDFGMTYGLVAPFDRVSNYRYPGKINLNTVTDPNVWDDLMGGYHSLSLKDWKKSREDNPLRAAYASNLVSEKGVDPVDVGLFRSGERSSDPPLFDFESNQRFNHSDRSAFFKNQMRQRLGNLTTNRSSVFAIWITIGFFEVDGKGELRVDPMDRTKGVEAGSDNGNIRRHRGFYIFDRSIPVGFEPGKNLNVDRAILTKTIVE